MNRKQRRLQSKNKAKGLCAPASLIKAQKDPILEKKFQKGLALFKQDKLADATEIFTDIMRQDPTHLGAVEQMGLASMRLGKHDVALNFFEALCTADPKNRNRYRALIGCIYVEMGRYEEAVPILEEAARVITIDEVHFNLAVSYMYLGDKDKAKGHYEKAVALSPDKVKYLYGYQDIIEVQSEDDLVVEHFLALEKDAKTLSPDDQSLLYFGLFKIYSRLKDYEKAMAYAVKGAQIKRAMLFYEADKFESFCDYTKKFFSKQFFDSYEPEQVENSEKPVLILAMPRSGTTLLEQILNAHPDMVGVGEDPFLSNLINQRSILSSSDNVPYPILHGKGRGDVFFPPHVIAEKVLHYFQGKVPDAQRIIDKGIGNFMYVGYMRLAFPHAKFIHIKRDAVDCCLSTFTHFFAFEAQRYSYDFQELADRYASYVDLMAHWEALFPDQIFNVTYEDLVENTEARAREIVEFLGMDWSPQCLEFYKQKSVVKTASLSQVRQPIYKSSVARWKRYGAAVKPLIEALGEHASEEARDFLKS